MFDPIFWQLILAQQQQQQIPPYFVPHSYPPFPGPMHKMAFTPANQGQGQGGGGGMDLLGALLGGVGGGGGDMGAMGGGGGDMGGGGGGDMGAMGGGGGDMGAAGGNQGGGNEGDLTGQDMQLLDPMSAPPMDLGGAGGPKPEGVAQVEAALAIFKEAIKKLEEALETLAAQAGGGATGGVGMPPEESKQAKIIRAQVYRFLRGM